MSFLNATQKKKKVIQDQIKYIEENSERLGRQARQGFEPGTSHLPVFSSTTPPLVRLEKEREK